MSETGQPEAREPERGHLMAGVMVLVAIMGVMSAVAVQDYAEKLRRDNEAEMMFRAQEIVRAIQRYRRDRGGQAPTELEQLLEPGSKGQYFLRRLYEDPLVKDGQWGLLFVGPGNTIVDPNADEVDPLTGAVSGVTGGTGPQTGLGGVGNSNNRQGGLGNSGGGSQGLGGLGNSKSKGPRSLFLNNAGNGAGQTGLPIAGVRTLSEDTPFRVYNGLTEYDQWLFTYFDLENAQIPGQRNLRPQRGGGLGGVGNRGGRLGGGFGGNAGRPGGAGRPGSTGQPGAGNPRNDRRPPGGSRR